MGIGSTTASVLAIMLIGATAMRGDTIAGTDRSAGQLAQPAAPAAPAAQPEQNPPPAVPSTAAPAPPANNPNPPVNNPTGTPAVVLDDQDVSSILGKSVRSSAGEDMGQIVDVLVGRDGQIRAAVIDFGGFLGIGTRKVAIDWRALKFAPGGKPSAITLELARDQVRVAPEYKRGEPVVVLGPTGAEGAIPSSEAAAPEK